jgi:excisionase family DNA binding protein
MSGMEGKELVEEKGAAVKGLDILLWPDDVATILGIALRTVHKLVRDGKLGCVEATDKGRRFTKEHVLAYIESRSVEPKIDKKRTGPVKSAPPKGGEKSFGFSRTSLREEMRSWRP